MSKPMIAVDNKTGEPWALDTRRATAMWSFLIAAAVARCWLVWLKSGFWLDETGTYYMISGNWHQLLQRMSVTSQSPLYCGLLWLVYHGIGSSEWILRMPSLLAMAVAAFLVYRLISPLLGPAGGLSAALIFITLRDVGPLAYEARQYSLVMTLVLASVLYFWRWLDRLGNREGALCVVFLAAAFYTSPTSGLMAIVYALVIAREALTERTLAWKQIAIGVASLSVLCLPILPYYYATSRRGSEHSFAASPGWVEYFNFLPGIGAGAIIFGLALLHLVFPRVAWRVPPLADALGCSLPHG